MFGSLVTRIFGSKNEREVKRLCRYVEKINALEPRFAAMDDDSLSHMTDEFKGRYAQGESLDALLSEAFAVVREAGKRVLNMRHFDVQLIGGMVLHDGKIAEMRTGEGKTLVGTLPVYLNAISGKGVHLITVNDYLARRDANWMRPLYEFLRLSVGVILPFQSAQEKRDAYLADITYGTNNEFGFDYLRDNMAFREEDRSQRDLNFAVVDEVDSILIDEARTPLIISGQTEDSSQLYIEINKLIPRLQRQIQSEAEKEADKDPEVSGDYIIDEKTRQVELTEAGHLHIEELLMEAKLLSSDDNLYSAHNASLLTHVYAALRAHTLFQRNVEYIVQDNQVMLIDEHTGRTMHGRRLSEGLHQAIEAKENLKIQAESQTLASTTFQNYFRLYNKLAGMTGTADTEAFEFQQIYGLDVVVIPTHRDVARQDANDLVFLGLEDKYNAVIDDIMSCQEKGQPVLVGSASIESSEMVSNLLQKKGIKHAVLNAKYHDREAEIIAQAGRPGAVTIATHMAGRGTDILLGGNWESEIATIENASQEQIDGIKCQWQQRHQSVIDAGGLHVIGTERNESRRIDNQLRGRSGRQGDPGSSRFYLSLEDNLMRIFASDRVKSLMKAMGMKSGEAIEHRMVTNAIEKAQRKVEGRNFDIRKQLLEYDDVANEQRKVIYHLRRNLLQSKDVSDTIQGYCSERVHEIVSDHIPPQSLPEQWDVMALEAAIQGELALDLPVKQWLDEDEMLHEAGLRERIQKAHQQAYAKKESQAGAENLRMYEKQVLLQVLDNLWKEHLGTMDHLRHGIHFRGYAQKNPKQEYKRESFDLFKDLMNHIKRDCVRMLSHVQVRQDDAQLEEERLRLEAEMRASNLQYQHDSAGSAYISAEDLESAEQGYALPNQPIRAENKVGRNDPCPCGSGKKYKFCHGQIDEAS